MADTEKIKLLRSLKLLSAIPDQQLEDLSAFLSSRTLADGDVVFEEGSPGDSLYFVTAGSVRIAKKLRSTGEPEERKPGEGPSYKELALLGPGDCFGEMILIEAATRSADAIAKGETILLQLGKEELNKWLESHPNLAMGFFAQIVQVLSGRLRRSSNELTLLLDLSQLLLEPFSKVELLIGKVMGRLTGYMEGDWACAAYVYNMFNDEMEKVDVRGAYDTAVAGLPIPENPEKTAWLDESAFQVVFPGEQRVIGYIVFKRATPLAADERNELTRTLTTIAHLTTSALENLKFRTEEALRSRLQKNIQAGSF